MFWRRSGSASASAGGAGWARRLAVALGLLAALGAAPAGAAPTEVRLRVEGRDSTVFEGTVTSDARLVDGGDGSGRHPCGSTAPTPTTALSSAGLDWRGNWNFDFQDFFIDRIGRDASDDITASYWAVLTDWRYAVGGCRTPLGPGADVLWAYGADSKLYVLSLKGPGRAGVGEPVTVTVRDGRIRPATGADGGPVAGAAVGGALTNLHGEARLRFDTPGLRILKAEHPDGVRSNALALCVGDVLCQKAGVPGAPEVGGGSVTIAKLRAGERFARGAGPRILRGTGPGASVNLSLALRGRGRLVSVPLPVERGAWSHQVARGLAPGRYRLRVESAGTVASRSFTIASRPATVTAARRAATRYLLRAQARSGGFAARAATRGSPLVTGWATIALASAPAGPRRDAALRAARRVLRSPAFRPNTLAELERAVLALGGSSSRRDLRTARRWRKAIEHKQRADGSFAGNVNLTAFALLALGPAEEFGAARREARRWLGAQRSPDGGFATGGHPARSDIDTTGAALWALAAHLSRDRRRRAVSLMRSAQAPNGGLGSRPGEPANTQSTALALLGLRAVGMKARVLRTEDGITPLDYLRAQMAPGGEVAYDTSSRRTPVWVTAQALLALADASAPRRLIRSSSAPTSSGGVLS